MSIIFTRAPLRISLGGGGTDLPSYSDRHEGFLIAGAIDKYVYLLIHTAFQRNYRMKYSELEVVDRPQDIKHPILRETICRHWEGEPLEVASLADVPAGTGLGSSGAYTVAVLKSLALGRHIATTPASLAEDAAHIEIDVLGEPVGKQDPYVAAHGGLCAYTFRRDGSVEVEPLALSRDTLDKLRHNLLLFFTGSTRAASQLLTDQVRRTEADDEAMLQNLHRTKEIGLHSRELLERGDLAGFAELMDEHWHTKRERSPGMETERVDELYRLARMLRLRSGPSSWARAAAASCSSTRPTRPTPAGDGAAGAPELEFDFEFGGCLGHANTSERAAAGRARRVRPDRRASARRRSTATSSSAARRSSTAPRTRSRRARRRGPARRSTTLLALDPDVRRRGGRPTTASPSWRRGRWRPARTCWSRSRPASARPTSTRIAEAAARRRAARQGGLQPPLPSRDRAGGRRGPLRPPRRRPCSCAPATATAAALGYDREWRIDPARSGGGELVDQGMHLLDLAHWLAGAAAAALRAAAHAVLGHARRGQRGAAAGRARRRARRPWALLHASWTEWKNLFSLEVYCRTGKLAGRRAWRGSYGPQRCASTR